jgi:hypothetical protein
MAPDSDSTERLPGARLVDVSASTVDTALVVIDHIRSL